MSRAEQASDRAAAFIIAQEDGAWTAAHQTELDEWLAQGDGNKAAYWRMKHSWREADRIGALGRGVSEPDGRAISRPAWQWRIPAAIAASIVAMVGAGYMWLSQPQASAPIAAIAYDTPVGGRKIVNLADGSRVQLNTASVVRTAVTENEREVWLDKGEAFFEVKHDGRPFVVHAGNRRITVLGTKFSVRRDGEKVTVSVVEGRVRIDDAAAPVAASASSATITGGVVAISQGDATLVTQRSEERVEKALAWREGMLSFDQASLSDVAAEFSRYNAKPLIVTDRDAASIRIGGMFPASRPDAFIRLLRDAYGLKVEETPDAIKISS